MKKADFTPNVKPKNLGSKLQQESSNDSPASSGLPPVAGNAILATVLGTVLSAIFYAFAFSVPWEPLQRYFLGHPISVAATVMFWFGIALLISKSLGLASQKQQLAAIRDADLLPSTRDKTPAQQWVSEHDAGQVARHWATDLSRLSNTIRASHLFYRLNELLIRQSQRGTTKHLADDLREVSARDSDAAHDSLGMVRIIAWAIPMLGFLGTVIGITQTLGGLDFSNGVAAVDSLKGGLYVAFDTTALGLVLSVMTIFLQFPVERNEQQLLAEIDARAGHLLSANLPSGESSDNQMGLIADLCQGVQAAIAESLASQAKLWRSTIDDAQHQWQSIQQHSTNQIAEAFESTLLPALYEHAKCLTETSRVTGDHLNQQFDRWRTTIDEAQELIRDTNLTTTQQMAEGIESSLTSALQEHATALTSRVEALAETQQQAESIAAMQRTLDSNLQRLSETNATIDRHVTSTTTSNDMAEAMRVLGRAVDILAVRLAQQNTGSPHSISDHVNAGSDSHGSSSRRAA